METSEGAHARVAVAFLGLDNSNINVLNDSGPEQNNSNLVFLLLEPPNLNA